MRIGIVIFKDDPQIGGGLTYVQEILEGLNRQLAKTEHRFYLIGVEPEKPAHLANIDLLCYLQPWMGQIRDIPYISTVWDLAHRVYPFFPEVSLYGEFGRRED